jgi:membrane protein DedA with SNARE-associated domain
MIEALSGFIIQLIQSSGYLGIFILMFLESALIPIPSEVTMGFAGFLVQKGELNFLAVVVVGALANLGGSLLAYAIGYYLEEHVILRWVDKYGKFLLLTRHDYDVSVKWLKKYGNPIAFFSRVLPAIRTFISLPAGLAEMNIWTFSFYTFIGSLIWSAFLTYIGYYFGANWNFMEPYFRQFNVLIVILFVLFVVWYLNHKLRFIKFRKSKKD